MKIELIKKINSKNKQVSYLEFKLPEVFNFKAGQFVILGNEIAKRAYSIATPPSFSKQKKIGFYVKKASENGMSDFLTQKINVGDNLDMTGPFGHMILPEEDKKYHYLLLSVGSGLAPIFSIFQELIENKNYKSINHFFGERYIDSIVYYTFEKIYSFSAEDINNYVYLSREDYHRTSRGYVQHGLANVFDNIDDLNELKVYLCGKPEIIDEITNVLLGYGVSLNNIKSEKF